MVNPFVNFNLKPTKYPMGTEMIQNDGMLICVSEKMRRIKEMIDQTANTDVTVLIQGESGVGKEVVARTIHLCSSRRGKPFVKVNCAALPPDLLESELFGYEKGAFTGAYRQKPGKFELAHGGTIFLDEIVEINLSLQAKLLQVLQDREFPRLGGKQDIKVDVRVLAATNKNMEDAVEDGRFREDLYYRLNVVNVEIPPLRERREEIPIFVEHFLEKFAKKFNKKAKPLPERMFKAFLCHPWSGNVRQLENVIQRYVVLDDAELILQELQAGMRKENNHVAEEQNSQKKTWPSLKEIQRDAVAKAEAEVIRRVLDLTNWNRKKAAERLNISYKALLYKIKGDGVNLESFDHLYPPSVKDVDRFYLKEVGKKAAEEAEKRMIEDTLQETHWNRKEAARLLRVSYKALLYKIQKYRPGESP